MGIVWDRVYENLETSGCLPSIRNCYEKVQKPCFDLMDKSGCGQVCNIFNILSYILALYPHDFVYLHLRCSALKVVSITQEIWWWEYVDGMRVKKMASNRP